MNLSTRDHKIISRHLSVAGLRDGARVQQFEGLSSVYYADTQRMWLYLDATKQARQHHFYHASTSPAVATMTCSHPVKFWDLRRRATVRETARMQGFPDSFVLPQGYHVRLFGNAVAVPCALHAVRSALRAESPTTSVRHLDVCAGIGGFSIAVRTACAELGLSSVCVGSSEIYQPAIRCYSSNFADVPALGDASHVERWPACDVLTAGFPCQPFSCANKTAIRSTHVNLDFCDIILRAARESGARMVILENVPSFRTVGRAQHDRLIAGLKSLSLHTTEAVLDATHFGVPQTRKRLFMVATIRQPPHIEEITALETSVASVLEDAIGR